MTDLPADLSPATAAWLQAQIVIHNARTAAVLREEITKVDDWACGIFVALRDVLGNQICETPRLGELLAGGWSRVARDFDRIESGDASVQPGQSLDMLEARRLLFRFYVSLGLMAAPDSQ